MGSRGRENLILKSAGILALSLDIAPPELGKHAAS